MSGYSKLRRKNPRKMRSLPPHVKAQNEHARTEALDRKRVNKHAARAYEYKLKLNELNEGELRILAAEFGVDPRDMDRDGIAVALIMRGWKP